MRVQIIDDRKLAIYIALPELLRCGQDREQALVRIAREEFCRMSDRDEVGELSLVAYSSGGEVRVFAERSAMQMQFERAVCVFDTFGDAALAVSACALFPRSSSLVYCEGRWYIELQDTPERLPMLLAVLCEYGEQSCAGELWLREHGTAVLERSAFEVLPTLA